MEHPICFPVEEQQTSLLQSRGENPDKLHRHTGSQSKVGRVGTTHGKPPTGFKTGTAKNIKEKENITPREEAGGGKGQNQDGRIFTFFYLRIQQCHLFPTGQRTREVLHVRIQEGKEGKDRDTA